jgi:esterase/lipase
MSYNEIGDIGIGLGFGMMFLYLAIAIAIIVAVVYATSTRRTQDYRKELTDMYVAGRIRQLAEKDKINLDVEYEAFKKWRKLRKRERLDIDQFIEEELKEKLEEQEVKEKKA